MRLLRQFDAPDILLYFTFSVFSIIYCRQDQTPSTFRESGLWANKNWIEILSFKLDYLTSWLAHTTILGWRVVTSPDSRSPFCRLFYLGTRSVASKGSPSSLGARGRQCRSSGELRFGGGERRTPDENRILALINAASAHIEAVGNVRQKWNSATDPTQAFRCMHHRPVAREQQVKVIRLDVQRKKSVHAQFRGTDLFSKHREQF